MIIHLTRQQIRQDVKCISVGSSSPIQTYDGIFKLFLTRETVNDPSNLLSPDTRCPEGVSGRPSGLRRKRLRASLRCHWGKGWAQVGEKGCVCQR